MGLGCQDNGDGTVTDPSTGLVWQQATADTDRDGVLDSSDELKWQAACDFCQALEFAGCSDWRLPGRRELLSLMGYPRSFLDSIFDCRPSYYWSGNSYSYAPDNAWG